MYQPFGINATKPWSPQLDLFRDVAPQPSHVVEPAPPTPAELPKLPVALANYGPWPRIPRSSWLHMFALHRHTDGRVYTIHPAFDEAPWLDAHAEALGYRPVYADCMKNRRHEGECRFAGDFCNTDGWRVLMEHRHLTRDDAILDEVARGVHRYKRGDKFLRLDYRTARAIMLELGHEEPERGSFSNEQMIVAVTEQVFFKAKTKIELTWQRIHAWDIGLVKWKGTIAVSIFDDEKATA